LPNVKLIYVFLYYLYRIPRHSIPAGLVRGWLINWWLLYMPKRDLILRDALKLSRQLDQMINRDGWNAIQIYTYLMPIFHDGKWLLSSDTGN
jgi:hypothetical protein